MKIRISYHDFKFFIISGYLLLLFHLFKNGKISLFLGPKLIAINQICLLFLILMWLHIGLEYIHNIKYWKPIEIIISFVFILYLSTEINKFYFIIPYFILMSIKHKNDNTKDKWTLNQFTTILLFIIFLTLGFIPPKILSIDYAQKQGMAVDNLNKNNNREGSIGKGFLENKFQNNQQMNIKISPKKNNSKKEMIIKTEEFKIEKEKTNNKPLKKLQKEKELERKRIIKLNIAELDILHAILYNNPYRKKEIEKNMLNKKDLETSFFCLRGVLYKDRRELNKNEAFLFRYIIVCCIAHAAIKGILLEFPDKDILNDFLNKDWVEVTGKLKLLKAENQLNALYYLEVVKIKKIPKPKDPYIFQWLYKGPFNY